VGCPLCAQLIFTEWNDVLTSISVKTSPCYVLLNTQTPSKHTAHHVATRSSGQSALTIREGYQFWEIKKKMLHSTPGVGL
jgi:hypothetical protein